MRGSTTRTLLWLDNYCLLRSQFGIRDAVEYLFKGSDAVDAAIQEALEVSAATTSAEARTKKDEAKVIGNAVSSGIMAAGGVLQVIPGVGTIAGAVVAAVGVIVRGLVALFTAECDRFACPNPVSYHRRALIGVFPPPGASILLSKGRINYFGRLGVFLGYVHDGLVEQGFGEIGTAEDMGRVIGVSSLTHTKSKRRSMRDKVNKLWKHWKDHAASPKIPLGTTGDLGGKAEPGTYGYRARKVYWVLRWLENKVPCQALKCAQEAMLGTVGEKPIVIDGHEFSADFAEQRMRGSRWYGSLVQMQRDLWVSFEALGTARTKTILEESRASNAAKAWADLRKGKQPKSAKLYFPWAPVVDNLAFDALRELLRKAARELHESQDSEKRRIVESPSKSGKIAREQEKAGGLKSFRAVAIPTLTVLNLHPLAQQSSGSSSKSNASGGSGAAARRQPRAATSQSSSSKVNASGGSAQQSFGSSSNASGGGAPARAQVQVQPRAQAEEPATQEQPSAEGNKGNGALAVAAVAAGVAALVLADRSKKRRDVHRSQR